MPGMTVFLSKRTRGDTFLWRAQKDAAVQFDIDGDLLNLELEELQR